MTQITLTGGFYEAKSLLSGAQRCLNLYAETNLQGAPYPFTYYLTPGLLQIAQGPIRPVRALFNASTGNLYAVIGPTVYLVSSTWTLTALGDLTTVAGPVGMADNRLCLCIVDGSGFGFTVDLTTQNFAPIVSDAFLGATFVRYMDTYFLFNRPNTNQWYWSLSNVTQAMMSGGGSDAGSITAAGSGYVDGVYPIVPFTGGHGTGATASITVAGGVVTAVSILDEGIGYQVADVLSASNTNLGGTGSGFTFTLSAVVSSAFDPLDIGAKTGAPDTLQALAVVHREVWLIGERTTEIWYNSGNADTAFERLPGPFIEQGVAAPNSVCSQDLSIFYLSKSKEGRLIVVEGNNYTATRISTYAIENALSEYTPAEVLEAIGFAYQQEGHTFYQLTFPSADKTWVYDLGERVWHERASVDEFGDEHRSRVNCCAVSHGYTVVGDFENGRLYLYDLNTYTDNGVRIPRRRGFAHLVSGGNRVFYRNLLLQMDTGLAPELSVDEAPRISLRYSDTHGATWGDPVTASVGSTGEFLTSVQFNQLGMARDRVFEVFWDFPYATSLQGAWIDARAAGT